MLFTNAWLKRRTTPPTCACRREGQLRNPILLCETDLQKVLHGMTELSGWCPLEQNVHRILLNPSCSFGCMEMGVVSCDFALVQIPLQCLVLCAVTKAKQNIFGPCPKSGRNAPVHWAPFSHQTAKPNNSETRAHRAGLKNARNGFRFVQTPRGAGAFDLCCFVATMTSRKPSRYVQHVTCN